MLLSTAHIAHSTDTFHIYVSDVYVRVRRIILFPISLSAFILTFLPFITLFSVPMTCHFVTVLSINHGINLKPMVGAARILPPYFLQISKGNKKGSRKPILYILCYEKAGCRRRGESKGSLSPKYLDLTIPFNGDASQVYR